ncbi:MAG TPA: TolC family protein, partial [Anaeromyxobacteraceae bacterium]|nr:TolC family protein [Anaeromyxobacteraceae bacterium]
YREGLLIQSNAAVQSTLSQYRVGKVPFISVLEVMRGFLADEDGYLKALADAQRIGIAIREVSLDAPPGLGTAGGITASSVPGPSESGAASGTRRVASAAGGAAQPGAATSSGAM